MMKIPGASPLTDRWLAVLLALLLLLGASASAARVEPPEEEVADDAAAVLGPILTLSAPGRDALNPQVAVAPDGDAVVVWERSDGTDWRIQLRARSATGVLSAVQTLSAAGQDAKAPQVAVAPDGTALVVWKRSDGVNWRIQARVRSAAGVLGPVQTLSAAGGQATDPRVATSATGDFVVVWQRFDLAGYGRIQARACSAAGVLSATQTLSPVGRDAARPQLGVDAGGNAVIAWQADYAPFFVIQARARSAAGALSPVQTLSSPSQSAAFPRVAVDPAGNAVVTWHWASVQARARSSTGTLSAVQTVAVGGDSRVAVDPSGAAVIAWVGSNGTDNVIRTRTRSAAGVLSGTQTLSAAGQHARKPQVAVDGSGIALFTWERFDGLNWRVQARVRTP